MDLGEEEAADELMDVIGTISIGNGMEMSTEEEEEEEQEEEEEEEQEEEEEGYESSGFDEGASSSGSVDEESLRIPFEEVDALTSATAETSVPDSEKVDGVYLIPPTFPGTESVVAFGVTRERIRAHKLVPCTKKMYWKIGGICSNAVKAAFKEAGFKRISSEGYNIIWCSALKPVEYRTFNPFQRINHFPGTWELGRKDRLCRNISKIRRRIGSEFDIIPRSFLLPGDYDEWLVDTERNPGALYISKPVCLSRGRGIHMVRRVKDVSKTKPVLIQRYIKNPMLINGLKFDLRVYVVVTSFDPLRAYLYDDGLARFATRPYSTDSSSLKCRAMHLTNYSVNSKKTGFIEPTEVDENEGGDGSKWTITALRKYLQRRDVNFDEIWAKIRDVVVKTLIGVESSINTVLQPNMRHRSVCYEIYGFDIMIDEKLKPWLIEVNTSPALQTPSTLDKRLKFPLVANMLEMIGIAPYDRSEYKKRELEVRRKRLLGLNKPSKTKIGDIRSLNQFSFSSLKPEDLPDVIRESEAELSRRGRFERVFPPTTVPPDTYNDFFDCKRINNILLCMWEKHKLAEKKRLLERPPKKTIRRYMSAR